MTYKIDVTIVDDHTMFVEGMTEAINQSSVAHVGHHCTCLEDCKSLLVKWCPDVLLLDISLPDGSGIDFCQYVLSEYPKVKVIAISSHDEYSIIKRMMDTGVHGYILKSSPIQEVIDAIKTVFHGGDFTSKEVKDILERGSINPVLITPVERQVLKLLCDGLTNPEIAAKMNLSTDTINWYRKRLLAKFNVKNSVSLAIIAVKQQII